ncbi:MAG: YaeQ family protein [Candidatus Margulisbacteria bacterium]|nr:YaeQ family protein [Candidatus Margulisiibacteriota bacterium]
MALKATIYKAELIITDMSRNYYEQHNLTLAKHPSETDERLMVRLLAFALYANERLIFGKGIGANEEPDLWLKDLTGAVELWIDVGQPDERAVLRACGQAKQVVLVLYGPHTDLWWRHNHKNFPTKENLTVIQLAYKDTQVMAAMAERNMKLTCSIDDGQILLSCESINLSIEPVFLQQPNGFKRQL